MHIFLHIGLHKTGTTAIQVALSSNTALLERLGILYPRTGRPALEPSGQHKLASAPKSADRARLWNQLSEEINSSQAERVVISSEGFTSTGFDESDVIALSELLSSYRVTVIAYLRRQDEYLQGIHGTQVLYYGQRRGIHEWIQEAASAIGDYKAVLGVWERAFGHRAITVRLYERSKLLGGDVVTDFFSHLSLSEHTLSVPPFFAEAATQQLINRMFPRNVVDIVRWMRGQPDLTGAIPRVLTIANWIYSGRRTDSDLLSPAERNDLLDKFKESNAAVAASYLPGSTGQLFDDPATGDQQAWEARYNRPHAAFMATIEDFEQRLGAV